MSSPVSFTLDENIGVIAINYPPVNALSQAVRHGWGVVGLDKIYRRVLYFQERFGAEAWAPAPLLAQLATE